jgi:hypothetical protein
VGEENSAVRSLPGDTVGAVEKYRAPFVPVLQERARRIMETGEGLEITGHNQSLNLGGYIENNTDKSG